MKTFTMRVKRTITSDVPIEAESIERARMWVKGMTRDDLFDLWYDRGVNETDNIKVAHIK